MLAIIIIGLSTHFNRSSIFFYTILLITINVVVRLGWAEITLVHALISVFLPTLLLALTLIPDRGILNVKAIPAYALIMALGIFSVYIFKSTPDWAMWLLLNDWLPAQYFDWTQLSQTALLVSIITIISLLIIYILNPSPHTAAGFGVLILLIIQVHFFDKPHSLFVFSSAALLMCLYAIMQESWRMAYLDELTGLPARRALKEKFQKIGGLYTVAMLDVDHFKKFNDIYGHDVGDAVLRMIAAKMSRVSGGGLAYRYGGEEFSLVFPGKNTDDAWPHLDTLREEIANSLFVTNRADRRKSNTGKSEKPRSVAVTVSIGISDSRGDHSSPWDILKLADKALYRAKGMGRNCVCE
ncbi:MAG: GGDEF domain-containing protein [Gammaproteobacteria bacterium]|nr:GGDEF domain-containing protein [Gammaproteobacteria bacterium]